MIRAAAFFEMLELKGGRRWATGRPAAENRGSAAPWTFDAQAQAVQKKLQCAGNGLIRFQRAEGLSFQLIQELLHLLDDGPLQVGEMVIELRKGGQGIICVRWAGCCRLFGFSLLLGHVLSGFVCCLLF